MNMTTTRDPKWILKAGRWVLHTPEVMEIRWAGRTYTYVEIGPDKVSPRARFDVARANQGQIVEYAYGGHAKGEHGPGDEYLRRTDISAAPAEITHFRLEPYEHYETRERRRIEKEEADRAQKEAGKVSKYRIVNSNGMQGPAWRATYDTIAESADAIRRAYGWNTSYLSAAFTTVDRAGGEQNGWVCVRDRGGPRRGCGRRPRATGGRDAGRAGQVSAYSRDYYRNLPKGTTARLQRDTVSALRGWGRRRWPHRSRVAH